MDSDGCMCAAGGCATVTRARGCGWSRAAGGPVCAGGTGTGADSGAGAGAGAGAVSISVAAQLITASSSPNTSTRSTVKAVILVAPRQIV